MRFFLQLPALPEFIQHRIAIFDKIKARRDAEIAGASLQQTTPPLLSS